jgi:hypothetical protein
MNRKCRPCLYPITGPDFIFVYSRLGMLVRATKSGRSRKAGTDYGRRNRFAPLPARPPTRAAGEFAAHSGLESRLEKLSSCLAAAKLERDFTKWERRLERFHEPGAGMGGFRSLAVNRIDRETASVLSVYMESPDKLPLPSALPGQFLVTRVRPIEDQPAVLRNYSLSGAPDAGVY